MLRRLSSRLFCAKLLSDVSKIVPFATASEILDQKSGRIAILFVFSIEFEEPFSGRPPPKGGGGGGGSGGGGGGPLVEEVFDREETAGGGGGGGGGGGCEGGREILPATVLEAVDLEEDGDEASWLEFNSSGRGKRRRRKRRMDVKLHLAIAIRKSFQIGGTQTYGAGMVFIARLSWKH